MDKDALRERVWDDLESSGEARFPFPPHGRIPNFAGSADAAERLASASEWEVADVVKANPDAPQLPVRRAALRAGKTVYVAVPRLAEERPFLRLDPDDVDDIEAATTVSGAGEYGEPVDIDGVEPIDLIVSGSVAVSQDGARVGKGEGYSDIEFALLAEFGRLDDVTVATTVHERQVVEAGTVGVEPHDVPTDLIVIPERVIRTTHGGEHPYDRPDGIDWDALSGRRIEEIPVLDGLKPS